jgi:chromosome segregation ATPase
MATVIQDILKNGKAINDELGKKISLLNQNNGKFKDTFTQKLKSIIAAIDSFKSTNLQGLTDTKEKLTSVTNELNVTKETLLKTQSELEQIRTALSTTQSELQNVTSVKNGLEQKERELNDKISQLETEYQNKLNGVRQEMSDKATQEKKNMQQDFDSQIAALNNEKADLQKGIQEAQQSQTEAVNKLSALQTEQNNLVNNLGEINSLLTRQLELISNINTDQPNDAEYSELLDTIQSSLGGVISEINQAVSGQNQSVYDVESNYKNLMSLQDENKLNAFLDNNTDGTVKRAIQTNISKAKNGDPQSIDEIKRVLSANQIKVRPPSSIFGGKRRTKTMKKKNSKTRKLNNKLKQRGGYVYSSSKELDKASSIVSSSGSKSRTKSKNKNKNKSKKTRTTSNSSSNSSTISNTVTSPNYEKIYTAGRSKQMSSFIL